MKKGTLAVALVVIFTLAMAGSALASWADSGYTSWSNEASAANPGLSPHAGYKTTTKNCSVCHAVHRATGGTAQVLLKTTVGNSCSFCHIQAGPDATIKIYGGAEGNYTNDIRGNHYDGAGALGVACADCHAVHSANTVTNGKYILVMKATYTGTYQSTPTAGGTNDPTDTDVTKWCSGCHPYYNTGYDGSSHVMKADGTTYANTYGQNGYGKDVAFTGSEFCTKCHNANASSGFPHYQPAFPRFITDAVTSTANSMVANNDGPCLRCHASATGIGTGF